MNNKYSKVQYNNFEDEVIVKHVTNNPGNLTHAFELAEQQLQNRTFSSINQRYYRVLKQQIKMLALGNNKGIIINTKNTPRTDKSLFNAKLTESLLITAFTNISKENAIKFFIKNMSMSNKKELLNRIINKIQ